MYNYPHYKEKDPARVRAFMEAHPFALLLAADPTGRVEATQVPVLVEERGGRLFLSGHVARRSDHQKAFDRAREVLVIFSGAHTYVSGTWYSNPQQASTWNYIAVHARGPLRWTTEEELAQLLQRLSLHFENGNTGSSTVLSNLPEAYREKLLKAIVGFEVEVEEWDNVYKLSQNRDAESYASIVAQLKKGDDQARTVAGWMEERNPNNLPS
jgi:transcriptional regulator